MSFPFDISRKITLPISGTSDVFPVNQVYCVGRNYAAHVKEMGADSRRPPFFFTKPNWTVSTSDVRYPNNTNNLQHEIELVIAIGEKMSIFGFAVGVDLTRRDVQNRAKKNGKPWFSGKSFIGSLPISDIIPVKKDIDYSRLELELKVDKKLKQSASCADMLWTPQEILRELSRDVPLVQGDLIFTGTPSGVGPVKIGDKIVASITGKVELSFSII